MTDFDPDAYLASKGATAVAVPPSGFDPDAYLKKKGVAVVVQKTAPESKSPEPAFSLPDVAMMQAGAFNETPETLSGRNQLYKGVGLQGGGAATGAIAGSPLGPLGSAAGAGIGAIIGNVLHQETSPDYDVSRPGLGIRKGEALASGIVSAILPGSVAAPGFVSLAREGLKQGAGGILAKNIETVIDEGRPATSKENLLAGVIPAIGGAGAAKLQSLSPEAKAAASAAKSAEQKTYEAGKDIGLVTTNESGKPPAVMGNLASTKNRAPINEAAAVDLGLPKETEITPSVLDKIREESSKPYNEIEEIATEAAKKSADIRKARFTATDPHDLAIQMNDPKTVAELAPLDIQAGADINGLRKARDAAKDGFRAYKRTADPKALENAQAALETANKIEDQIQQAVVSAGKSGLLDDLAAARQRIAKTYDYEQALNSSNGDISAPVLGRLLDQGRPLSGNAKVIADFNNSFPFATREGATVMAPGVTRAEGMTTLLSTLSGAAAGGAAGHPGIGAAAGLLPLTGPLKRQILLSQPYQAAFPKYPAAQIPKGVLDEQATALRLLSQAAGQQAGKN